MKKRKSSLKSPRRRAATARGAAPSFHVPRAISFLTPIAALVSRELEAAIAELPKASIESDRTNLAHVLSHWHDDHDYVDARGRPHPLPLRGPHRSLEKLIRRTYPRQSLLAVVQALLRSGAVRRRHNLYECNSRQLVFKPGVNSYVSGLLAIQGLVQTLRANLSASKPVRLLQRSVTNAHIPLREVPALYRAIDRGVRPLLESLDADMVVREQRAQEGEPLAHVGLSVQVFNFPSRNPRTARKRRSRKKR